VSASFRISLPRPRIGPVAKTRATGIRALGRLGVSAKSDSVGRGFRRRGTAKMPGTSGVGDCEQRCELHAAYRELFLDSEEFRFH